MPELCGEAQADGKTVVESKWRKLNLSIGLSFIPRTPGVYFLLSHDEKMVKIGKSMKPRSRIRDIRQMNPHYLHVLLVVPGYSNVEYAFHARFGHYRSHCEWFHYMEHLRDDIAALREKRTSVSEMLPGASARDVRALSEQHLARR